MIDRNFDIFGKVQKSYEHDIRRNKNDVEKLRKKLIELDDFSHLKKDLKHALREFKVDVRNELRKLENRLERLAKKPG